MNLLTEQNDKMERIDPYVQEQLRFQPYRQNDFRRRIVKEEWPMFTAEIPAMKRDTMPELETVLKKV